MPIRSNDIPAGSPFAIPSGARWVQESLSFEGCRDLVFRNARGKVIVAVKVTEELADADLERALNEWYARKVPNSEPNGLLSEDEDEPAPPSFARPRLLI